MLLLHKVIQQFLEPRLSSADQAEDTEKRFCMAECSQDPHLLPSSHRRPSNTVRGDSLQPFQDNTEDMKSSRSYRILPIFSGIMIPFSIMLLIPSLTGHWYIRTGAGNVVVEVRPNPLLLNFAMGVSMGCGVIASACLVARFAERNVKLMTQLCIAFLFLHDIINIPVVTIFGVVHRFDDGFTYGQPFWLTVCSTIASTATNITLVYDYKKTVNFARSGTGLTHRQRYLVIIIIILLVYMSLGSGVISVMLKSTFIDALYFSVVSIETIGFGDIHPSSPGSRAFVCVYITGGILNLALAVALSREVLIEAVAIRFQNRMKAAKAHERERHILTRWRAAVRWRLQSKGLPVWINDHAEQREGRIGLRQTHHWYSSLRRFWRRLLDEVWREWEDPAWKYVYGPNQTRLNLEALSHSQLETAALEAGAPLSELVPQGLKLRTREQENVHSSSSQISSTDVNSHPPSLTHVRIAGMVSFLSTFAIAVTHEAFQEDPITETSSETTHEVDYSKPTGNGAPLTKFMTTARILQDDHMALAKTLEIEERNAFYGRLGVACILLGQLFL
ncbi:hypothetical protein M413DRAFT_127201 [Hebeloma cylindrosporum]|uniref:Potassium channel domain-containing protein n=1 Tax=Hebeloma cylindrosporum TaxID=76867 RepID=A0A0C2XWW1_HEBCY|nr:hypothetical protein M413DRAFT_127201 [Hebeloma cylindrosporum h7]